VKNPKLHPQFARVASPKCHRGRMLHAPYSDWMEWQAGYVSGALLMPARSIREVTGRFLEEHKLFTPIVASGAKAGMLINLIHTTFAVSGEAARVRLLKLKLLSAEDQGPQLL
jgi:Zn-dependent peptidase ImmA (M78 family)